MEATIIYPHQLFKDHPAVAGGRRIYLVEESLILTHNPIHRQKLIFHKLTMDAYERQLTSSGFEVVRLRIGAHPITKEVFKTLKQDGVKKMHIVDTTDNFLERAITQSGIERVWYESPLFLLEKSDACERFVTSNRFIDDFYTQLRIDHTILTEPDNSPVGGSWMFNTDHQPMPSAAELPEDISMVTNVEVSSAARWAEQVPAEQFGESGCWLPYTQASAEKFLQEFFRTRLSRFSTHQDTITTTHTRLFHSSLSALINVGLLTPEFVLHHALEFAREHDTPIQSIESFVRYTIGWREFIRASYEVDGSMMRNKNFFEHHRKLPASFWSGATDVAPVDHAIKTALTYGYNHHSERLMVLGNFMLLTATKPTEAYRLFMGLHVDAYDWVVVPNVFGLSQYADGGSFATKPSISDAAYLKKMSDYPDGDWEAIWTALYWNFIDNHKSILSHYHHLKMMPRLWEEMDAEKKLDYRTRAKAYIQKYT